MADPDYVLTSPRKVNAIYDYTGEGAHELKFNEGDSIEVINTFSNDSGWWYGKKDGKCGIFPSNYTSAPATPRKMKKNNRAASQFIKRMQSELGFIKVNGATKYQTLPDGETGMDDGPTDVVDEEKLLESYQKVIVDMRSHIELLLKQMDELEADKEKDNALITSLSSQLDEALKKEEEMYELVKEQREKEQQNYDALREQQKNQEGLEEERTRVIARLQRENELLVNQSARGGSDKGKPGGSSSYQLMYVFVGLFVGFFAAKLLAP